MSEDAQRKLQLIKVVRVKNEKRQYAILKILKDEDTGEKFHEIINEPMFTYYLTDIDKEEKYPNYVDAIPIEDTEERNCLYSKLFEDIAYQLDETAMYKQFYKAQDFDAMKAFFHLDRRVHGSDVDLEDFYIGKHYEEYPLENSNSILTKAFFDIEVYTENYVGFPDPEIADCPIDQIGYFDTVDYTFYGFLLDNPNVSAIKDFKDNETKLAEFKDMIYHRYKDQYDLDIKIELKWFKNELKMIASFWERVNTNKPDFLSGWNIMGFDIPYLLNRTQILIINKKVDTSVDQIICSPELDDVNKYTYLYNDRHANDFADKGDYFIAASYTNYVDGMLLFANLRKIFGKRESYELNAIAAEELGEAKEVLDPNNEGITIKNIVSRDYARYIKYNIHDVMLLYLLENKNSDIDQLYSVASMTETRIHKCLKKTVCLKNLSRRFNKQQGYISSNNHNATYNGNRAKDSKSFRGAFVADPNLIDNVGMDLGGNNLSQFLHEDVIDFDLSALYPSITLAFNISPMTYYGKVVFPNETDPDRASDLFDRINSRDYINLAKDEFGLPTPLEILDEIYKGRKTNG